MADDTLNRPVDVDPIIVGPGPVRLLPLLFKDKERDGCFIQPEGDVFLGGDQVTTSTGIKYFAWEKMWITWTNGIDWYATAAVPTKVRALPVY